MLTEFRANTLNIFEAIPTDRFISLPTRDRIARSLETSTKP